MAYNLLIERRVIKFLAKIPNVYKQKIVTVIDELKNNPKPVGAKKLVGRDGWRIRINDYRIIYIINNKTNTVLIINAGHRKSIYQH